MFVKSRKAAERVMKSISKFIEKKLKLLINQEKSKTAERSAVKFLCMTLTVDGTLGIVKKSLKCAMQKVKKLTQGAQAHTRRCYKKDQPMVSGLVQILQYDSISKQWGR